MAVSATLDVALRVSQSGANAIGGPFWNGDMILSQAFSDGVAANQVDRVYLAERTVNASTNDDIDLNGVITDALGGVISAVELVGIFVMNRRRDPAGVANVSNLTIGAGTNPVVGYLGGTTPTVGPIKPGGMFLMMNPDATGMATITASTGDILRIANGSGGAATYTIGLLVRTS